VLAQIKLTPLLGWNEFHYSERPMCQQFRFASEGQSRSSRLLAERSPVCKHRLCRFGSNAVVIGRAAGSDESEKSALRRRLRGRRRLAREARTAT
jgi:hypothetical protein